MSRIDWPRALLRPRTVALVGASGDPQKNTSRPQRYLRRHGFAGRVVPVNPGRDEILGVRAYPSVADVPGPVDHAFVMVPAAAVPGVIEQCGAAGVPVATIFSDGFAEAGPEGRARQRQLQQTARAQGVRLLGPNSAGLVNLHERLVLSVNAAFEAPQLRPGPLALVSHSGSLLGALLSRGQARGFGFSQLVSVGNECDLSVGAIAELLVDDPRTGAILLFLENLRDAERLAAMARRAYAAGKPVIVYKLGRSDAGRELALSHTGALAGADEVAEAFFRHHGMVRVDSFEGLLEIAPLLRGRRPAAGRRVGVLTTAGGGAAMVVDRLGALGMELAPPPPQLVERLARIGLSVGRSPVVDLTLAGTRKEVYAGALNDLLASPDCDAVVAVVGNSGQFRPELAVEPIIAARQAGKALAAFIAPEAARSLELLGAAGIAAFRTPEACADAVRAYLEWAPPTPAPSAPAADLEAVAARLAAAPDKTLDAEEARQVLELLGIPQAPARALAGAADGSGIGYPVAVKILSPDVLHKTECGGLVLDVGDDGAFRQAAQDILGRVRQAHPQARLRGLLAQRMERGLAEALLGYRHDPQVGPTVTLGMGGALAEVHRDFVVRLAPVGLDTARAMVAAVRGLALVRGYRALPRGDCEALVRAVQALSWLALVEGPRVLEAEVNPLVVKAVGEGVVGVDGLVVCG